MQRISAALSDAVAPADVVGAMLRELIDYLDADHGELRADGVLIGQLTGDRMPLPAGFADTLQLALRVGEREVGQLGFDFNRPHTSTQAEETFLSTCTTQCAHALVRAQPFAEASERSDQQAAVASPGTRALEDVALPQLLQEAAQTVLSTLRAEGVTITQPGDAVDVHHGDSGDSDPSSTLTPIVQ